MEHLQRPKTQQFCSFEGYGFSEVDNFAEEAMWRLRFVPMLSDFRFHVLCAIVALKSLWRASWVEQAWVSNSRFVTIDKSYPSSKGIEDEMAEAKDRSEMRADKRGKLFKDVSFPLRLKELLSICKSCRSPSWHQTSWRELDTWFACVHIFGIPQITGPMVGANFCHKKPPFLGANVGRLEGGSGWID